MAQETKKSKAKLTGVRAKVVRSSVIDRVAGSAGAVLGVMGHGIARGILAGLGAVGRCTGRAREGFRLRMKFFSIKHRLDDLFAVLGRKCYRSFGEDEDFIEEGHVNGVVRKIGECKRNMKEIEDEVGGDFHG